MWNKVQLQPTYILHSRAYRDTSLLLELFTLEHGRVSVVARGAKGVRSRFKGILQPFVPLITSWQGGGELMNLHVAEPNGMPHGLMRDALLCGLYLNELLMRLLHRYDPHPSLYSIYQHALTQLQQGQSQALTLRLFEKQLLVELGYAVELDRLAHTGEAIVPELFYHFDPARGLSPSLHNNMQTGVFAGKSLLALHQEELDNVQCLRDAKRILRLALNRLLGNKPIKSRELFYKE